MPRYRRYRRKRGRRSYRRAYKRRNRFKRLVKKYAGQKYLSLKNGKREYVEENRSRKIDVPAQKVHYICHTYIGSVSVFENIINSTGGQDGQPLGGTSTDPHRNFRLTNYSSYSRIRNLSEHPVYMTAYILTPRRHLRISTEGGLTADTAVCTHLMNRIKTGWEFLMDATGDAYVDAVSGSSYNAILNTDSTHLWPSQSREFNKWYRIVKRKSFTLQSGGIAHLSMKVPNFTFNKQNLEGLTALESRAAAGVNVEIPIQGIKNITRILLLRIHGEMGIDPNDQSKVGLMAADLGAIDHIKARVFEVNTKDHAKSLAVTTTAGIVDLEGPTDDLKQVDD